MHAILIYLLGFVSVPVLYIIILIVLKIKINKALKDGKQLTHDDCEREQQ